MPTKTKPSATTASVTTPLAASFAKSPNKSALVIRLLSRAKGATIAEIAEPTGWQPHSTRAYLSGLRKKRQTVIREQRKTGETAYRIVHSASPAAGADATPVADAPPMSGDGVSVADAASADAAAAINPASV